MLMHIGGVERVEQDMRGVQSLPDGSSVLNRLSGQSVQSLSSKGEGRGAGSGQVICRLGHPACCRVATAAWGGADRASVDHFFPTMYRANNVTVGIKLVWISFFSVVFGITLSFHLVEAQPHGVSVTVHL
jgi:hypothetical protein